MNKIKYLWIGYQAVDCFNKIVHSIKTKEEHLAVVISRFPGLELPNEVIFLNEFYPLFDSEYSPEKLENSLSKLISDYKISSTNLFVVGSPSDVLTESFLGISLNNKFQTPSFLIDDKVSFKNIHAYNLNHENIITKNYTDKLKEEGFNFKEVSLLFLNPLVHGFSELDERIEKNIKNSSNIVGDSMLVNETKDCFNDIINFIFDYNFSKTTAFEKSKIIHRLDKGNTKNVDL